MLQQLNEQRVFISGYRGMALYSLKPFYYQGDSGLYDQ